MRWCPDGGFFGSCISSKPHAAHFRPAFYIRTRDTPCVEVSLTSNLWPLRLGEERKKKKERKRNHVKTIMACRAITRAKDVLPNIHHMQGPPPLTMMTPSHPIAAKGGHGSAKACFLSLMTFTFDLDIQTHASEGPNTFSLPPQPFYGPFSRTTRVSRWQKKTSGLYSARED